MRVLLPGYPAVTCATGEGDRDPRLSPISSGALRGWWRRRPPGSRSSCWTRRISTTGAGRSISTTTTATGPTTPNASPRSAGPGPRLREGAAGWRPDLVARPRLAGGVSAAIYIARSERPVPSILTIHNIAFAGLLGADGIAPARPVGGGFQFRGVRILGQGLVAEGRPRLVRPDHDRVSPATRAELTTPEFGMGFDGLHLEAPRRDLRGILNGIDPEIWDPAKDPAVHRYRSFRGKAAGGAGAGGGVRPAGGRRARSPSWSRA